MKIQIRFHTELTAFFGKNIEIELDDEVITYKDLIKILHDKLAKDNRKYLLTENGNLNLVIIEGGSIKKLNDIIEKDTVLDFFPILAGG